MPKACRNAILLPISVVWVPQLFAFYEKMNQEWNWLWLHTYSWASTIGLFPLNFRTGPNMWKYGLPRGFNKVIHTMVACKPQEVILKELVVLVKPEYFCFLNNWSPFWLYPDLVFHIICWAFSQESFNLGPSAWKAWVVPQFQPQIVLLSQGRVFLNLSFPEVQSCYIQFSWANAKSLTENHFCLLKYSMQ